jgi:zinc protease
MAHALCGAGQIPSKELPMRKRVVFVLAVALLLAGVVTAMENPLPKLKVEQYKLSNGLTVILYEDHSLPIVGVNVTYFVGSKNEKPGKTGFAHLFEHMMFQGSKNSNQGYFKPLQEIGGTLNGSTNTDRTQYWEMVPAGYLERALWMEADRMGFLLDAMTQERLSNQISVVSNERRQNYENRPYGTVREKIAAVLYPPNHPYSWLTIGSIADLQAASLDDVKDFFRTYYTPNNASLCVTGDFDPTQAKRLVEKLFGALPPGPPVSRLERWVPEVSGEVALDIQDRVQLPRTTFVWPTVPVYSANDAALDVFGRILGGGKTSRLYQKLVYEKQIAQDAMSTHNAQQISGTFNITLTPRPGRTTKEVEAAALEVLQEALDKGITKDELERVQTITTADYVRSMQSIGGFRGLSDRLNEYYQFLGQPDMYRWDLQRYLDLTPEGVTAAARRHLGADRLVARVTPMPPVKPETSELATKFDRAPMPGQGPENPFKLPARQRFKLANGLDVVLVEYHNLPLVNCYLLVRGGSSSDPTQRAGLASMTATLLQEGAAGRTSQQIAEGLEGLGAEMRTNVSADATAISLSAIKTRLDDSLALFSDVLTKPDFPAAELERQRKRLLVRFQQMEDQPEYLANLALARVLFPDYPYGHLPTGNPKAVGAITLDDVKGFWKANYMPANADLIVVGDVTRAELETKLAPGLGAWKEGKAPSLALKPAPQHGKRTIYLIDKPGAAQSVIATGLVGLPRSTKEYVPLEVLNAAFGGQFVSRLNLNLREDKGYTYGARSRFQFDRFSGTFTAGAPVQTKVTVPALKETLAELEGIAGKKPITDKELSYAQGTIVNGYARRFETPGQIAMQLSEVVLYGLPDDSLETFPKQVMAVKAADLARLGAKVVLPDNLAIVVVGDAKVVKPELEKLQIGPIVELDKEGNPIAAKK